MRGSVFTVEPPRKNLALILLSTLFAFAGCTAATSHNNANPYLRPQVVKGEYRTLFNLAKSTAVESFPDGQLDTDPVILGTPYSFGS